MTSLSPTGATRVLVATRPVDFRKGMDGLSALVTAQLGGQPYSDVVTVFRAKKADRINLVWWDGTGLCLMAKHLENGRFSWPSVHPTFCWSQVRRKFFELSKSSPSPTVTETLALIKAL